MARKGMLVNQCLTPPNTGTPGSVITRIGTSPASKSRSRVRRGSAASASPGSGAPASRAISATRPRSAARVIRVTAGRGTVTHVITKTKLHGNGGRDRISPRYSIG